MALNHITEEEIAAEGVVSASDVIKGTPAQNKAIFDNLVKTVVAVAVNLVIDEINAHEADTTNPHAVTAEQVGLGSVDDTADANKPVSTAQAEALDLKADKTNVLEKDNVAEFTPTSNYHPSTKKYVDDVAASLVLGQIPDGSLTAEKLASESVTAEKLTDDVIALFAAAVHAATHATGGSDPITPASIDAASAPKIVTVTFPTSGWVLNSTTNCYEQTVACLGLLSSDGKNIRVEPVGSTDATAQALTDKAFSKVDYWVCNTDGYLYARCSSGLPSVNFPADVVISR